jgi:uncharacterized protein (UPF0335 family)
MKTSNYDAATMEIVDKWSGHLDAIAKEQVELKDLKARAKDDGFNLKCLAQVVKERRKGAAFQVDQLMLELEVNTYRENAGLPTTVEDAQDRARKEAAGALDADDKPAKKSGGKRHGMN